MGCKQLREAFFVVVKAKSGCIFLTRKFLKGMKRAYILNHVADLGFYYKYNVPPLRHLKDLYVFSHISGRFLCEKEVQDQEAERTVRRH